jgi:hypothetical protein
MEENSELFYDKYKPIYNHLEHPQYKERQFKGESIGSEMYFETYGRDLEYVKKHDNKFIWTLIEVDGNLYIKQGFCYVNRLNYLIASKPYIKGQTEFLDWQEVEDIETWNEAPYGEKCDQMEIIDYQNNRKEMLKKLKTK